MIPKIIHYCWLSNDPIPENLQKCMTTWKKHLTDYEFIKWDFSRFDKESSMWVTEAFDNKKYAFAADYIRLYAVYNYGGIYLDMDVEIVKSFDPLLNQPYMLAFERECHQGIEAGCFGAEKNNSYISDCLKYYKDKHFLNIDGSFDQRPLPQIMQEVMNDQTSPLVIFDHDYFTAKSYETGVVTRTERTYAIHHFSGSWKTDEEKQVIADMQKYSRIFGNKLGRNFAEYKMAFAKNGISGILRLTQKKIEKRNNKEN